MKFLQAGAIQPVFLLYKTAPVFLKRLGLFKFF